MDTITQQDKIHRFAAILCVLILLTGTSISSYAKNTYKKYETTLTHSIQFTFSSPINPWTDEEQLILKDFLNEIYPLAVEIYGEPHLEGEVNIKKNPNLISHGLYDYNSNEISIKSVNDLSSLCHEVLHAFRDDLIIPFDVFEEGMVRAAEVEIFNRITTIIHWNKKHSYIYDYYYDALNKPSISSINMKFPSNPPLGLLRYEMASYVWAKILIEDKDFLKNFNDRYYSEFTGSIQNENLFNDLLNLVISLKSTVENTTTENWLKLQHILNRNITPGLYLIQRMNPNDVDAVAFDKDISGSESLFFNKKIYWEIYDHKNKLIDTTENFTGNLGWVSKPFNLDKDYSGRIKIIAWYQVQNEIISDTVYRSAKNNVGIFGVVKNSSKGNVKITYLNDMTSYECELENGSFYFQELEDLRGTFLLEFTSQTNNKMVSKVFTKDASKYYVLIDDTSILTNVKNEFTEISFNLKQNYPNPFNSSTKIDFSIPEAGNIKLEIYDLIGRKVRTIADKYFDRGSHSFNITLKELSTGVYIYRLENTNNSISKKMIYLK